jgi:hypothetical protein
MTDEKTTNELLAEFAQIMGVHFLELEPPDKEREDTERKPVLFHPDDFLQPARK